MIVTQEWLNACRTPKGGFTRLQLACLGVAWPPVSLWHKQVVGRDIPDSTAQEFVNARLKRKSGVPYVTEESKLGMFADQRARRESIPRHLTDGLPDVAEGMTPIKPPKNKRLRNLFNPEKRLMK